MRAAATALLGLALAGAATPAPPLGADPPAASSALATPTASARPTVEYVGHAAVIVESSRGTRVLIDPFNSDLWLGYRFPAALDVDAVAITHPHFDHDAHYYLAADVPVFRRVGTYRVADVTLRGIAAEHAGGDRYRERGIEPFNTVWAIEVDGTRFLHIGDNGPPSDRVLADVGSVDVLFTHPFFSAADTLRAWGDTDATHFVLVHHRLPGLSRDASPLVGADEWLADRDDVERLATPRWQPQQADRPGFVVLEPAAGLRRWSTDLERAWEIVASAAATREEEPEAALAALAEAAALAPGVIEITRTHAEALLEAGRPEEARRVLEEALRYPFLDTEGALRARAALAGLAAAAGEQALARALYRRVLGEPRSYAAAAQAEARAFLERDGAAGAR